MKKFLWFTDLHLDMVSPWSLFKFIRLVNKEDPEGLILTGDISNGLLLSFHLEVLAKNIKCPIYFVMGNHDVYFTNINDQYNKIRKLCSKYDNLIWLTESGIIHIDNDTCFIGHEGWFDASHGAEKYLKYTFDSFMIGDFRKLSNIDSKISNWQKLADDSVSHIEKYLKEAIELKYKNIYIMTHYPPWREATYDVGTWTGNFWISYNCNLRLGRSIEKIMFKAKKSNVNVLCGHSHEAINIRITKNIECEVGSAHYLGLSKLDRKIIYI